MAKRVKLSDKDDNDLCSIATYSQTIDSTPAAVRKGLQRGVGPVTVRMGRCIKFRVGDVKAYLQSLERVPVTGAAQPATRAASTPARIGRPRSSADHLNHK